MIINKLVFPIKFDLSFVEGGIPQGMLTANSINRDILYVISPAVKETVITAFFQNQKQTEDTQQATFVLSDLSIDYLVSKDTSYYELVKDWNVWQTTIPSKALEFISYNRAGEIGISFAFKQLLEPSGYEGSQEITNDNFVINDSGSYIIKIPYYNFLGNDFTYNDVLIYNGGDEVSKKPAIALQGTTGTLEYSVDPSVYMGGYEEVDIGLTESILSKLGENSGDIKLLRLKFNNYYTIEEVDGLLGEKVDKVKTGTGDSAINQVYGTDYLGNDKVFKASEFNVPRSVVQRDFEGVIDDLRLHNVNQNAHPGNLYDPVYHPSTHKIVFQVRGGLPFEIDLPSEWAFHNVELIDNELVFTMENGEIIKIPLNDLLVGVAKEQWVEDNFVDKNTEQTVSGKKTFIDKTDFLNGIGVNGSQITNVADGTDEQDAVNKRQLDTKEDFVVKTPYFYKALQQYMDAGEDYATFLVAWKHSLTVDVVAENVEIYNNYINHSNYDYQAYGIIIPEGVLSVNSSYGATFGSYNKPIVFPDSVMAIEYGTFAPLYGNKKEVVLPKDSYFIGAYNFTEFNSDYPVVIPSLVNEIGNESFYLATIPYMVMLPQNPPSIASTTFGGSSTFDIYVSDIYYDDYYYATNWVNLRDRLKKLSELELGG